jgi:hypothetical protein
MNYHHEGEWADLRNPRCGRESNVCSLRSPRISSELGEIFFILEEISSISTRREIGIVLPNSQRQHRTLHIQKDVPPCAFC